eukprot:9490548-Pyramimonas_sp.AAC.2
MEKSISISHHLLAVLLGITLEARGSFGGPRRVRQCALQSGHATEAIKLYFRSPSHGGGRDLLWGGNGGRPK